MAVSQEHGVIGRLRWEGTTEFLTSKLSLLLSTRSTVRPGQEVQDLTCLFLKIPRTETPQPLLLQCLTALMEAGFFPSIQCELLLEFTPVCLLTSLPFCDLNPLKPHPLPVKPALGTGTPLYAHGSHECCVGEKGNAS